MKGVLPIISLVMLSGCATFVAPTNECRVSHFNGKAETGYAISLEADASGDLEMVRVVQAGSGCKGMNVEFNHDGLVKATVVKSE